MSNNLDRLFKKALQGKTCDPPPYIWENIGKQLDNGKHKMGLWWWRSVAAAAVIAAFLGVWLLRSTEAPEIKVAGNTVVDVTEEIFPERRTTLLSDTLTETEIPALQPLLRTIAEEADASSVLLAQDAKPIPVPVQRLKQTEAILQSRPVYAIQTRDLRRNYIPLTSGEAIRNQKEYMELLRNTKSSQDKEKRRLHMTVSGHFIPAYSSGSYSSSLKNSRGAGYSDAQMTGLMNAGGGIQVSVAANKRFSVKTGLLYSRMGQKTSEPAAGVRAMAFSTLQNSEQMITTPLGNIKSRTKAVAYRSPQAVVLNSMNKGMDETIEQTFGTLEIPLHVSYLLNDNKVAFTVSAGFSGNFIVNNKVYLKSGNNKEYMGSTEDIRNFNISTDFGLGMEYPVTPKIKVMVEPGFKYYLQSLSENENIDFKPYLFTFSTGIGINF